MAPLSSRVTLPRVLTLLGAAWVSLWACAPPSTLPAPVPLGKTDGLELGGGAVLSAPVGEDCRTDPGASWDTGIVLAAECSPTVEWLADVQHWGLVPLSDQLAVGWMVSGGVGTPGIAGGGVARYDFMKKDTVLIGLQGELGWAWGSIGVPVSGKLGERFWVYTHPSVGYRMNGLVRAPVGLGVELGDALRLDVEAGMGAPFMQGAYTRYESLGGVRPWVGAGVSGRLGR